VAPRAVSFFLLLFEQGEANLALFQVGVEHLVVECIGARKMRAPSASTTWSSGSASGTIVACSPVGLCSRVEIRRPAAPGASAPRPLIASAAVLVNINMSSHPLGSGLHFRVPGTGAAKTAAAKAHRPQCLRHYGTASAR
jgi:hypothetical protein